MRATMMNFPLTLTALLERAGKLFANSEIVARLSQGPLHRCRYADFVARARALGGGLQRLGLGRGERVATLMSNHHVHLEAYFGVPCAGGVLHTLNPRLHPDDLAYIVNHAGERFLIVDDVLLPVYEAIRDRARFEKVFVVPLTTPVPAGFDDYEELVRACAPLAMPALDEHDPAGMGYTSGTTGRPKGVVYSHRAIVLHSLASAGVDCLGVGNRDSVCPVVPMYHVNAWGLPFTAVMAGSKLVFPGPHLDAESLLDLYAAERVTLTAGVPTIWAGILAALAREPGRWALEPGMRMVVGGAAAPASLIAGLERFGLNVVHGWGMTETTPIGTVNFPKRGLSAAERDTVRAKQGVPLPFFEVRALGAEGEAPWDGRTMGELQVRGPWVAAGYHEPGAEANSWTDDGWFRTGDIATIDAHGYVEIADRAKDLVKSGGEWVSSAALENALIAHPKVAEAAVIAVPHSRWGERPLAVVVLKTGESATADELRAHLAPRFLKFWLPDGFEFVAAIPRNSTGKMMKATLREQFKTWKPRGE